MNAHGLANEICNDNESVERGETGQSSDDGGHVMSGGGVGYGRREAVMAMELAEVVQVGEKAWWR